VPRFRRRPPPDALICGRPVFDASMPRHRRYLRYLTHAMVWLNTLSFDIPDAMCGLRVYPLAVVLPVLAAEPPGRRMDFDVEALVRLHWRGLRMRWLPVGVSYPVDGVSQFRLVRDNWLITCMHTRLFFGMLRRARVARRGMARLLEQHASVHIDRGRAGQRCALRAVGLRCGRAAKSRHRRDSRCRIRGCGAACAGRATAADLVSRSQSGVVGCRVEHRRLGCGHEHRSSSTSTGSRSTTS
jgi:hypothetical protein